MAIYGMLQGAAFGPEAVKAMTTAYEGVLQELKLSDRSDPLTEIVARTVIDCAQTGERDPRRLRDFALNFLAG
jgi:hypothetical protein